MDFGNLEFIEYPMISFGQNFSISTKIYFGKRNVRSGLRNDALYEYVYNSNKYNNFNSLGMIKITTDDYICFTWKDKDKKEEILISYPHFYKLRREFNCIKKEVDTSEIFLLDEDNHYSILPEFEDTIYEIGPLVGGKMINVVYDVGGKIDVDGSEKEFPGVRIFLNTKTQSVLLNAESSFMDLVDFLNDFNFVLSSQNLINFAYMNTLVHNLEIEDMPRINTSSVLDQFNEGGKLLNERSISVKKEK